MKKILVPTDFSDNSMRAINYANDLSKHFAGEITLLHTFGGWDAGSSLKSLDRVLEEDALREMTALREKLALGLGGVAVTQKLVKGDAVSTIVNIADHGKYDLIIMGTKGASGLKEIFIGSIAGGVISKTKTPVLVIPEEAVYCPLELIVFGISGMPLSSDKVVKPLREIAKAYHSDITVLHLSDKLEDGLSEIMNSLNGLDFSVVYEFGSGNINQRINNYISESDADMLCLIRQKRSFFEQLFGSSVTLKQTFHSTVPLLILQN